VLQFIRRSLVKRIALVGNGPGSSGFGREIDAHDKVIRFNAAASQGTTGDRTDVLVLVNTGESGARFATDPSAIKDAAFIRAAEIWFPRHPKVVQRALRICPPEDREFWQDFSGEIIRRRLYGKPFRYLPARTSWHAEDLLRPLGMEHGMQPSSGMMVIADIHRRNKISIYRTELTLYGFTHEGWSRHPWNAERAFIEAAPWITKVSSEKTPPGSSPAS
jgi:hypothetical protein